MNERISRRRMLHALGVGGAGLALAACGGGSGGSRASSNPNLDNNKIFGIPDAGPGFPKGSVSLRWTDSGDQKAVFFDAFFPAYQSKRSNVHVTYDGTNWNTIQQEITLGLRNGTAPDVFQLPPTITIAQAVAQKWIAPLDDFVPNWKQIKAGFPVGTFAKGTTDFGGKTYGYPFTSNQRLPFMLLFNKQYMERAGYDPGSKTLSWDEFRAAAKKCTQQGSGKYYGLIMGIAQTGQIAGSVSTLAEMSGVHGGLDVNADWRSGFDYSTGSFNYTNDTVVEAVELMLAMKSDGSFFPGTVSLDAPGARGRFPTGVSAMILQGPWNIPKWMHDNPGLQLGAGMSPVKNPKDTWPLSYGPGGSNTWVVANNSKAKAVAGDIFAYLGTLKGQTMWADYDGAGDPPQFKQTIDHAKMDALSKKALGLGYQWTVLRPDATLKTSDLDQVLEAIKPLQPSLNDVLVGLFTGQISKSPKAAMKDVQDRSEAALDAAIATAKSRGANVSRDDWKFPDWNPRQTYTYHA